MCNSGYGEVGVIEDGRFVTVARLPGWTRGLTFCDGVALVGTSRVIPRFRAYAPGLDVDASVCGVHALDTRSGTVLGSLCWPIGNQLFSIEAVPAGLTSGFPFAAGLQRVAAGSPEWIPWCWGINGFLSVLGAAATPLVALALGLDGSLVLAAGLYLLAGRVLRVL